MPISTVSQADLAQALKDLRVTVATRSSIPVILCVLIEADAEAERLRLTTTNLEVMLTVFIPAVSTEDWSQAVPCRLLENAIADLTGEVTLEPESTSTMRVLQPGSGTRIKGCFPAGEYVSVPVAGSPQLVNLLVDGSTLLRVVPQLAVTASKDEFRPVFTGITVEVEDTQIVLASADSYRLGYTSLRATVLFGEGKHLLVPVTTFQALAKLLPKKNAPAVQFCSWGASTTPEQPSQALFTWENHRLITRLIDGTFPDWRRIVPGTIESVYRVSADDLAARLATMQKLVGGTGTNILTLDFGRTGELELIYNDEEELDISRVVQAELVEGSPFARCLFNLPYLLDAAKTFKGRTIELRLKGPQFPMLIADTQPDEEPYETVLMPLHTIDSKRPVTSIAKSVLYPSAPTDAPVEPPAESMAPSDVA